MKDVNDAHQLSRGSPRRIGSFFLKRQGFIASLVAPHNSNALTVTMTMTTAADSAPSQNGSAALHEPHILIIGAGITGLVLAQALKKHGVAFTIFDRDAHVAARGRGWGLTIHWSLDTFLSLLPQHIVDKLPQVYVDPEASKRGENGNFLFFDLRSGEARWKVPPNKRIRVSRERLRALLLEGLDVKVYLVIRQRADIFVQQADECCAM